MNWRSCQIMNFKHFTMSNRPFYTQSISTIYMRNKGFIPSMELPCENKNIHLRTRNFFFVKVKTKNVSGVARWKLKIYSKHSSNKEKTKKKKNKVVLWNKKIYPWQQCQKVLSPFTHMGHVAEIFKPLGVSLGASLESRLSPCS